MYPSIKLNPPEKWIAALWLEFAVLYIGAPLLILFFQQRFVMLAVLWLGALFIHRFLRRRYQVSHSQEWNWAGFRAGVRRVMLRFAILATVIAILVRYFTPESFLSFPRQQPELWLLVMVLYPILSVWPQELIYRTFMFCRYYPLFGEARGYVVASALVFGFVHVIFLNWIAPIMTFIGGALFAASYRKHQSLALSCFEHSLYGCLVFTIGLGSYFFTGAAWQH